MLVHDLLPPSAYKEVDTLQVARRHFKFTSNRLDSLAKQLGIGEKLEHGGFDVWKAIIERRDPAAWKLMRRYNKHDVVLLEQLYLRLRPWMDQHPNLALISDKPRACPKCGAAQTKIKSRGWRYYQVTKRRAFRCNDCGGIFYGRHLHKSEAEFVS
jgi:ribosomal protein S27AE